MSSASTQAAELIPQPWRDDLIEAAKQHDIGEIDAITLDLMRRFPDLFWEVPQ